MTDGLRFESSDPVRAYRDEEPVDLGPPTQRAVLEILLAQAGRPVPLSRIVAALWAGDPPSNGDDVVLRCIGGLRRALDPERTSLIALTESGYVLRAGDAAPEAEPPRPRKLAPTRVFPTELPPTSKMPAELPPTAKMPAELPPTSKLPAEPPPTAVMPKPTPAPSPDKKEYPEPTDPWEGHDLFPPDPMSIL